MVSEALGVATPRELAESAYMYITVVRGHIYLARDLGLNSGAVGFKADLEPLGIADLPFTCVPLFGVGETYSRLAARICFR